MINTCVFHFSDFSSKVFNFKWGRIDLGRNRSIYSTFIFRHTFSLDFLIQMVYNKEIRLFVWFFCNSHAVGNQMAVFPQQEVKIIMDYVTWIILRPLSALSINQSKFYLKSVHFITMQHKLSRAFQTDMHNKIT